MIDLFNWIVDNGYFNKIKIVASVHDEVVIEFPEQLKDSFPKLLESVMEASAAKYCKSLPIPAEGAVDICWRH